jgi:anti-sigma B factor antagonist
LLVLMVVRRDEATAVTIVAEGDADLTTVAELESALYAAVSDAAAGLPVLVDLAGVRFLDSIGIAVLLKAHRRAVAAGRSLRVVRAGTQVREVLKLTGVWLLLSGEPS